MNDPEVEARLEALRNGEKLTPEEISKHTEAMVGYHYTVDDYYEVGREKIREFSRAVQNYHPVHWNEDEARKAGHPSLIAPLTFVGLLGLIAQRRLFEDVVQGYDLSQILQSEQRLVFHRPIRVGDQLVCDVSLDSYRRMGGVDLMVTKNIIRNFDDGELVQTTWTSLAGRSTGELDPGLMDMVHHVMMAEGGRPTPNRTVGDGTTATAGNVDELGAPDSAQNPQAWSARNFDELSVGDALETRTVKLTRGNLVNYAGVVGDPNPIHFSSELAKLAKLDDVVAHGMLTMGIAGGAIGDFVGDPGAVFEYNVRFTSPVYVPATEYAEIEVSGKIKSLDSASRTGEIAITVKQGDRKIFGRATARVKFN
ncbi:fused (3R)-hydroxyacyl-ACP dehydratase subunits HadA/HadB [Jongsikchunia kroppenstedtii]|uniref:fused (3R)-hydroxyacyl-ACP dehydratase subunits HadA/HadB n=1 Tax=Jongsikchunia kroppenstedtii TaxID=1121721 RepID=UPI000364E0B1|nr:fused (3R)-hydroxyacyl-ACP dehydratase subunits HadA/HadB [Jongsikchunia kroppenstedtii]